MRTIENFFPLGRTKEGTVFERLHFAYEISNVFSGNSLERSENEEKDGLLLTP